MDKWLKKLKKEDLFLFDCEKYLEKEIKSIA
jgi:hypothetical protein